MEPILAAESVRVAVDKRTILNIESLNVRKGEVMAMIGPNGAGKSTLLGVLACLQRPTAGRVFFRGQEIASYVDLIAARRRMAMVFQEPFLLEGSVFFNVAVGLKIRGVPKPEIEQRVGPWLERFKIANLTRQNAKTLSGGEAQRVSLARAFVLEPEVLFLDEPFTSLDAPTKVNLVEQLEEIIKMTGVTTIFVTHDATEIPLYANRIVVMERGEIVRESTLDSILSHLDTPFLASFFRKLNGTGQRGQETEASLLFEGMSGKLDIRRPS